MNIKDTLQRDPATYPLVNQGQARISDNQTEQTQSELRGELETFVCEGQYAEGVQRVIRSFLDNVNRTSQRGAWVNGFFGSGKSHLLKMLCHLWRDTAFRDGVTARSLVPSIPEELRALLRELDTAGKRAGGLFAAAGALPSGTTDNVRLTVLAILLRAAGLPEQFPTARFCLWLNELGIYDQVKALVERDGKFFERELNNLYVSAPIARALIACDKNFASSEAEAKQLIKAQFPTLNSDITTEEFLRVFKDVLRLVGKGGRIPCTLLILDEAQQYIGSSNDRSVLITEVAEAVSKQLDSHVMIVAAGQSALTEMPLLQKLMDRFTVRVPLSDTDVETVTRKVLLQKKPSAVPDVRAALDKYAGEISRQLQGTRIGETVEDRAVIVEDYPLLPARRRFWENCFRQIDAAGTQSQLRSQLRIVHDAVASVSEKPLGTVIPADELFKALAPEMVTSGILLREINERITKVRRSNGELAERICGLVFLIGKLKRDSGVDIGVRATKEHIADLLVDDLAADNGKLRAEVDAKLRELSEQGELMLVGDEYRLQTRESGEWDREFRNRQTRMNNDDAAIQFNRENLVYGDVDKVIRSARVIQGAAKEPRQFVTHRGDNMPISDGSNTPVWIRDGWSCTEKEVLDAARAVGNDSPIVFVFIPRRAPEDLRRLIVDAEATRETLDEKGNPVTAEGQEARQSMESRHARSVADRDRLVRDIVTNAKVFQGGGSEVLLSTLDEKIKVAAETSLVRLFPRFKEADSPAWDAVIKRARDGADHPFQPVGHSDATEKHAVCQQVLSTIGAGKSGTDVRKTLATSPFGWPRDAVDAALIALHRLQHISATLNGQAIQIGQLDQNKIAKAEFRVEQVTLSVTDRLTLRKLFQELRISCKSGEEAPRAVEFLKELVALARAAGGPAPLPDYPSIADVEDIQRLIGNDQLVAIKNAAPSWEQKIKNWTATRDLIAVRAPTWTLVEQLANYAELLPVAEQHREEIAAIRDQRLLLDASDPANTVRVALAASLRAELQRLIKAYDAAFASAVAALNANAVWIRLDAKEQEDVKATVGLKSLGSADISTDEALCSALAQRSLSVMQTEIDAIPSRLERAIERAARLLEPELQTVMLERATLKSASEVEAWIELQKTRLLEAVKQGPVLVN